MSSTLNYYTHDVSVADHLIDVKTYNVLTLSRLVPLRDCSLSMGGGELEDFVKFSAKKPVAPPLNFAKNSVAPLQTS